MADMLLQLVAVERTIWSGCASMVIARTAEGDIGGMPGHAAVLAEFQEHLAATILEPSGDTVGVAGRAGFLAVTGQGVEFSAEGAGLLEDVQVATARAANNQQTGYGSDTADDTRLRRACAQLLGVGETL